MYGLGLEMCGLGLEASGLGLEIVFLVLVLEKGIVYITATK